MAEKNSNGVGKAKPKFTFPVDFGHGDLRVSENRRFLQFADGTPFFYLADTAWELFHKLNREEADLYLENRAERGFTAVQAVALAEFDGLETPNAYGRRPLKRNARNVYDPTLPDLDGDYSYWDHVDYIVRKAASLGLFIAFLPTWGDKYNRAWGKGPEIFNGENARVYGRWLGTRYKEAPNIIWVLGGDRPLETRRHFEVIRGMAEGLREGDGGRHLMTFHPCGGYSSSHHVHDEDWLDFNMIQSGHAAPNNDNHGKVEADYKRQPTKPVLDGEPRYEDHPVNFKPQNGYFDDFDVRQAAYWAVFAGACGHTYGHHCIWFMQREYEEYFIMPWTDAILRPGGSQMQHLRRLIESRPFFERVPDQELLVENYEGASHLQATRGKSYAFVYSPNGLRIKVRMGRIDGERVVAHWYNPRDGSSRTIGEFRNEGVCVFLPPSRGRREDWVLVLDDADAGFPAPGAVEA
ncbi:MAG: glycoside hydrolase family 140 protein [Firmicutes bacterium]|nr:glycoside hydrolase family 140 protein [Bacillota bacterium]